MTRYASTNLVSYEFDPQLCVRRLLSEFPVELFGPAGREGGALSRLGVLLGLLLRLLRLPLPLQPQRCGGVVHAEGISCRSLQLDTWMHTAKGFNVAVII